MTNVEGWLVGIFLASSAGILPQPVTRVRALKGFGLEGDRYALGKGEFSERPGIRDVTLIESEAIKEFSHQDGVEFDAAQSRRNLITRDVRLNDLVGREFMVGQVRLRGLRLCEPCTHLARLTGLPVLPGLVNRGGLYAEILEEGELAIGDAILEKS